MPRTMSWVGTASGAPFDGERMLLALSISTCASSCASIDSGTCTAIWSPSKSALKAVQRGRAVQEHGVLLDDVLQDVPHLGPLLLHVLLGRLDGRGDPAVLQLAEDERLEQLQRHLLRQPALVELQVRPHHDDGAAGVVDALAEQVLPEAALLALEGV